MDGVDGVDSYYNWVQYVMDIGKRGDKYRQDTLCMCVNVLLHMV